MVHGKTFPYYNEALITFLPTYKYDVGTDDYDTSDKARIPAWCDRILSTSKEGLRVNHLSYSSGDELTCSDHRPVKGLFDIDVCNEEEKRTK